MNPTYPLRDIRHTHCHDVLLGRGSGTYAHVRNSHWRMIVAANKQFYVTLPRRQKMLLCKSIVNAVRSQNPPGRFLQKDRTTDSWHQVGDRIALQTTSQALREGAPQTCFNLKDSHANQGQAKSREAGQILFILKSSHANQGQAKSADKKKKIPSSRSTKPPPVLPVPIIPASIPLMPNNMALPSAIVVSEPRSADVLLGGRGNDDDRNNNNGQYHHQHPGNQMYQRLLDTNRYVYLLEFNPTQRQQACQAMVSYIRAHGGRFLWPSRRQQQQHLPQEQSGMISTNKNYTTSITANTQQQQHQQRQRWFDIGDARAVQLVRQALEEDDEGVPLPIVTHNETKRMQCPAAQEDDAANAQNVL